MHDQDGVAVLRDSNISESNSSKTAAALRKAHRQSTAGQSSRREPQETKSASRRCSTDAPYVARTFYSSKRYAWGYNSTGQPKSSARTDIVDAGRRVGSGTSNSCGSDNSGLVITSAGNTSDRPGISASGKCTSFDGKSVVGFGDVDGSYLAWACTKVTTTSQRLTQSDILFDNSSRAWHIGSGSCSSGHDLKAVAMHEFGHAVGLSHTDEWDPDDYYDQVMYSKIARCSSTTLSKQRDLGRGDQNGLFSLYGPA
ncbi:matrixin family metalloprotease [Naumannella halotolerans]